MKSCMQVACSHAVIIFRQQLDQSGLGMTKDNYLHNGTDYEKVRKLQSQNPGTFE